MNDQILSFFSVHGLPGLVIAVLFFIIFMFIKQGKEERREWLTITDDRQKETNEVIRNLTAVIERKVQ